MTFSLVARDETTGAFGVVVTSSSPAVAARCAHVRAGVGAGASQNVTNPALGPRLLRLLAEGVDPKHAVAAAVASDEHSGYRQLAVVDAKGRTAAFSGEGTLGTHRAVEGSGVVAAGNLLSDPGVVDAMLAAYERAAGAEFEERLLAGLLAGRDAGGEEGPEHSAGLVVVHEVSWPVTDLRVDWADDDPMGELEQLWRRWAKEKRDYLSRALDPAGAPSYGVPGDL
ncbi:DUF1028 domain-containing protein [Streptomyces sp. NPDC056112]|uniref:DUF1028 domain-containing protein n=1 Tax=unclassified Streptomyces TaxID=2593676 RepID=UPI0024805CBE|nr:DUF1028 domain-containing protein [Streptomyces sp. HYC2]